MTGVRLFEFGRTFERRHRLIELTEAIIHPAEAVVIGGVVRFRLDGPLDHARGAIQKFVLVGPKIPEIVERRDVLGILIENILEEFFGYGKFVTSDGEIREHQSRVADDLANIG